MNCIEARRMVTPFIKKELSDRETEQFLDHIEHCADCMDELDIHFTVYRALDMLDSGTSHEYDFQRMLDEEIRAARGRILQRKIFHVAYCLILLAAELLLVLSIRFAYRQLQDNAGRVPKEKAVSESELRESETETMETEAGENKAETGGAADGESKTETGGAADGESKAETGGAADGESKIETGGAADGESKTETGGAADGESKAGTEENAAEREKTAASGTEAAEKESLASFAPNILLIGEEWLNRGEPFSTRQVQERYTYGRKRKNGTDRRAQHTEPRVLRAAGADQQRGASHQRGIWLSEHPVQSA